MLKRQLLALLPLVVAGHPAVAQVATPAADPVATQREAFVAAFNRGDAEMLRGFYAPDAAFLSFTGQAVLNPELVAAGLSRASSLFDLDLKPLRSGASGSMIYEAGTWQHREKGTPTVADAGTYLWLWRKDQNGAWVIHVHSVNRKPPPSASP